MIDLLRSIKWYFKFFFLMFMTHTYIPIINKYEKTKGHEYALEWAYTKMKKWCKARVKDSGIKVCVYGEENIPSDTNVLFICNHQGDFDIPILVACVPKHKSFVAKIELGQWKILKRWMDYLGCVLVDRKDMKQSAKAILEAINLIKKGKTMVIFPEGKRSRSDELGEFKAGSFKLATKTNVPIVPITIDGSYKVKEQNNNIIKPTSVNVYVHEPIIVKDLSKEEKDSLPEVVKQIIASKLPQNLVTTEQ